MNHVQRTLALHRTHGEPPVLAHSASAQPVDVPQIAAVGDSLLVAWTSLADESAVHVLLVHGDAP
jgi:hypothetical protein